MTTNKATPGPWYIEPAETTLYGEIWIEHDEGCICLIPSPLCEADHANAALIVKAVNNHDALVAALEECLTDEGSNAMVRGDILVFMRRINAINKIVQTALANAKGE